MKFNLFAKFLIIATCLISMYLTHGHGHRNRSSRGTNKWSDKEVQEWRQKHRDGHHSGANPNPYNMVESGIAPLPPRHSGKLPHGSGHHSGPRPSSNFPHGSGKHSGPRPSGNYPHGFATHSGSRPTNTPGIGFDYIENPNTSPNYSQPPSSPRSSSYNPYTDRDNNYQQPKGDRHGDKYRKQRVSYNLIVSIILVGLGCLSILLLVFIGVKIVNACLRYRRRRIFRKLHGRWSHLPECNCKCFSHNRNTSYAPINTDNSSKLNDYEIVNINSVDTNERTIENQPKPEVTYPKFDNVNSTSNDFNFRERRQHYCHMRRCNADAPKSNYHLMKN